MKAKTRIGRRAVSICFEDRLTVLGTIVLFSINWSSDLTCVLNVKGDSRSDSSTVNMAQRGSSTTRQMPIGRSSKPSRQAVPEFFVMSCTAWPAETVCWLVTNISCIVKTITAIQRSGAWLELQCQSCRLDVFVETHQSISVKQMFGSMQRF